jgi:hypothetical protein
MGYAIAIIVFAILFHIGHVFILYQIGSAIAAAAIMSIGA